MSIKLPKLGEKLLQFLLRMRDQDAILGDIEEIYADIIENKGRIYADVWYWLQVFRSVPGMLHNHIYWFLTMFVHYMTITLRNIKRQKTISAINILGLSIGLACSFIIILWVQNELSYDRFHKKRDQIFRVESKISDISNSSFPSTVRSTPTLLGPALKDEFPEIVEFTRYANIPRTVWKVGDNTFYESGGVLADRAFFTIFDFEFIVGDPKSAFANPKSIILTEAMADKYFHLGEPIGKTMQVEGIDLYTVTGVIENIPNNSHLQFDYILPFDEKSFIGEIPGDGWAVFRCLSYVQLTKCAQYKDIDVLISEYHCEKTGYETGVRFYLKSLTQIHLDTDIEGTEAALGGMKYVLIFSSIALIVLFIACINFINLTIAQSAKRYTEVGMRKTIGAHRNQLAFQFFGESFVLMISAFIIALVLVVLFLPAFNTLSGKNISIDYLNPQLIWAAVIVLFTTVVCSGAYPAAYLSSFKPVSLFKGVNYSRGNRSVLRRYMIIMQFTISIVLIFGLIIISGQLDYMRTMELGFDKENVLIIPIKAKFNSQYQTVKSELMKHQGILSVTAKESSPMQSWGNTIFWEDDNQNDQSLHLGYIHVGYDYFKTLGVDIVKGRDFSRELGNDHNGNFIINEKALEQMGLAAPIDKKIALYGRTWPGKITGVIKNVHRRSLHEDIVPELYIVNDKLEWEQQGIILIRIKADSFFESIADIERIWTDFNPEFPFEYHFLDQTYDNLYKADMRINSLFKFFTFLAIFTSCLGLFGLSIFVAEQRTKEIGVRKVLGATVPSVAVMLAGSFMRWIVLANIFAWPIAYFTMKVWLRNFAYTINFEWWMFPLSGLLVFSIALITVSYQTFKSACKNPIEFLKYE